MKPKDAAASLQSIIRHSQTESTNPICFSWSIDHFYRRKLPLGQQVIRVMPNTSSMIGESATAVSAGKNTSKQNILLAEELLQCIGEVYVIPEDKMDIFTGIAGSGPAYFYYLMEHIGKRRPKSRLKHTVISANHCPNNCWRCKNDSRTRRITESP